MIELIPAIDVIDGKCVRLSQGDYQSKKVYNENPVEVAKMFEAHGIHRLHVVDLDGAASKHVVNYKVLEALAGQTSLVIDFGGGIKRLAHCLRKRSTDGNAGQHRRKGAGYVQPMDGGIWQ